MTKFEFWGFISAIVVGTIPAIISILYAIKAYKRSQIDKYGTYIYEKQFDLYSQIYPLLEELNDVTQLVFINLQTPSIRDAIKETGNISSEAEHFEICNKLRELVKKNSFVLPNKFIENYYLFNQLNNIVRDTISSEWGISTLRKDVLTIENVGGLKEFSDAYYKAFIALLKLIKDLLGTEYLTERHYKYARKGGITYFQHWNDRSANIK